MSQDVKLSVDVVAVDRSDLLIPGSPQHDPVNVDPGVVLGASTNYYSNLDIVLVVFSVVAACVIFLTLFPKKAFWRPKKI